MTTSKIALLAAALTLGSALSPALAAEADNAGQSPLAALAGKTGAPSLIEGRQAAPIASPTRPTATEGYLDRRVSDAER